MKQIVGTVPANTIIQSVELRGTASPYINEVHYNTPTGPTPSGPGGISNHSPQSIYVIENNVNLSGDKINSTDYRHRIHEEGRRHRPVRHLVGLDLVQQLRGRADSDGALLPVRGLRLHECGHRSEMAHAHDA